MQKHHSFCICNGIQNSKIFRLFVIFLLILVPTQISQLKFHYLSKTHFFIPHINNKNSSEKALASQQIHIFHVDNRLLSEGINWWESSSAFTNLYCKRYNYKYYYLSPTKSCWPTPNCTDTKWCYFCEGYDNKSVPIQWMKVKAIQYMLQYKLSIGDIGIFIDTDAMINYFGVSDKRSIYEYLNKHLHQFYIDNVNITFKKDLCSNNKKLIALMQTMNTHWRGKLQRIIETNTNMLNTTGLRPVNSGIIYFVKCPNNKVTEFFKLWWKSMRSPTILEKIENIPYDHYVYNWPHEQSRLFHIIFSELFNDMLYLQHWWHKGKDDKDLFVHSSDNKSKWIFWNINLYLIQKCNNYNKTNHQNDEYLMDYYKYCGIYTNQTMDVTQTTNYLTQQITKDLIKQTEIIKF